MNEKLKKVLVTLGLETAEVKTENVVKLAEQILDNGTIVVSEEFKEGSPIFIKSVDSEESEDVALPIGEYTLENGDVLVVEVEGEILSITTPEAEPKEEEETPKEEVKEELEDEPTEDYSEEPKEEVMEDDHAAKMADMESRLAKLEEMLAPAEEIIEEEVKEELSEEVVETVEEAVELSEEVVFSPEAKTPSNNNGAFKFPQQNVNSPLNRVYNRLNK